MALIAQTNGVSNSTAPVNLTRVTLTASDTLTYTPGAKQMLVLTNPTASIVTATLTGTAPTPVFPAGYGGSVSTSGGKAVAIPANGSTLVPLDSISAFLAGTGAVTVTGGTGAFAVLFV